MTISELVQQSGFSKDTIRYYEKIGLIRPADYQRGENGYKDYRADLVAMLQLVHLSKQHGFSLNEVKRYLRVQGNEQINCTLLAPLLQKKLEEIDQKIKALAAQRENLLQGIELLKMC